MGNLSINSTQPLARQVRKQLIHSYRKLNTNGVYVKNYFFPFLGMHYYLDDEILLKDSRLTIINLDKKEKSFVKTIKIE